jgi:hypothetical protein
MSNEINNYSVLAATNGIEFDPEDYSEDHTNGNEIDLVDYSEDLYELDINPVRLESSNSFISESSNSSKPDSLNFRNQVRPPLPQYILAPGNVDAILDQSLHKDCETALDVDSKILSIRKRLESISKAIQTTPCVLPAYMGRITIFDINHDAKLTATDSVISYQNKIIKMEEEINLSILNLNMTLLREEESFLLSLRDALIDPEKLIVKLDRPFRQWLRLNKFTPTEAEFQLQLVNLSFMYPQKLTIYIEHQKSVNHNSQFAQEQSNSKRRKIGFQTARDLYHRQQKP